MSVHVLRHSFASALAQSGVDPHTLATLLGHSSLTCTARYAHLSPEGLRASTKLLDSPPRRTKKSR